LTLPHKRGERSAGGQSAVLGVALGIILQAGYAPGDSAEHVVLLPSVRRLLQITCACLLLLMSQRLQLLQFP